MNGSATDSNLIQNHTVYTAEVPFHFIDKPILVPIEVITQRSSSTSTNAVGSASVGDIKTALCSRMEKELNLSSTNCSIDLQVLTIKEELVDRFLKETDVVNISSLGANANANNNVNYGSLLVGAGGTIGAVMHRPAVALKPSEDAKDVKNTIVAYPLVQVRLYTDVFLLIICCNISYQIHA